MEFIKEIFTSKLFWGFVMGFTLCVLSLYSHFKTKMELKRLKGHLSDKLEIEAEKLTQMKGEIEGLKGENENLRMKVTSGRIQNDKLDLERELEIYARAEKAMNINAPGFAGAWERAKEAAMDELIEEERGKSMPRRIFRRLFTKTDAAFDASEALPEHSTTSGSSTNGSEKSQQPQN
ncbi:MAG: hypothetical protein P1U89_17710 [Verrucomicrobiales bacterium]|nr:hypothetical protein [Verrucomicrobiales bacterium]